MLNGSQNPAVSLLSVYTSIADEKDPKLCMFRRPIASMAKKYLTQECSDCRLVCLEHKERKKELCYDEFTVDNDHELRANLLDIHKHVHFRKTHSPFGKESEILSLFRRPAKYLQNSTISRGHCYLVFWSTFILSYPKLECGVQIIAANNNILKFKSHRV